MAGVGVFVCSCDDELSRKVDVDRLARELDVEPNVVEVVQHPRLCSEDGLKDMERLVASRGFDGVLVVACAQDLFDSLFRPLLKTPTLGSVRGANLDLRVAGQAETDRDGATAERLERAREALQWLVPATDEDPPRDEMLQRALVIGGGIGGIQSALDIANSGYEVVLVERQPSIGGRMIQLSETFPSLDCSQCILTPRMAEAGRHPKIRLLTLSEVTEITGRAGHFTVKIRRNPRYVDDTCTACGDCADVCPALACDQFDTGLRWRKAIHQPFPQAVPSTYNLDPESCLGLFPLACGKCEPVCDRGAIDYDMPPTVEEVDVGAIVVATGYELYSYGDISEYGYGKFADVINGFQFERLLSASGPTLGKVVRPSDGKVPKEVVFIQCVRSRDSIRGVRYCSGICCMYTAKHAMLYQHRVHDGQAFVFYLDIRAGGKGYEEFVQRAMEKEGVMYLRGRVSRVFEEDGKIVVWGVDTLIGKRIEVAADLVVLATAMVPNDGHQEIAKLTGLKTDEYGFMLPAHPKTDPVDGSVPGYYLVGCCQGPMDIPDTVAQASAAAAKVCGLFARGVRAQGYG